MKGALYGWMKQLAVFYIFLTAVMNFLPDEKYARYIRYFTGMLLILLVLSPLLELLNLKDALNARVWEETVKEKAGELPAADELQGTYLRRAYEQEIARQIQEELKKQKIQAQVTVTLREEEPAKIEEITVRTDEEIPWEKKEAVQDELEKAYGIRGEILVEKHGETAVDASSASGNPAGGDRDADR